MAKMRDHDSGNFGLDGANITDNGEVLRPKWQLSLCGIVLARCLLRVGSSLGS